MIRKWLHMASMSVLAMPVHAAPSQLTARTLFDLCNSDERSTNYATCTAYTTKVLHEARSKMGDGSSGAMCIPDRVTGAETAAIFVHMALAREDFLIGPSDRAVGIALEMSFPCAKSM